MLSTTSLAPSLDAGCRDDDPLYTLWRDHAARANGPVVGDELVVTAASVERGDYLPPQCCLEGTPWQACGFRVAKVRRPVPERLVLFGPLGVVDCLGDDAVVRVVRSASG